MQYFRENKEGLGRKIAWYVAFFLLLVTIPAKSQSPTAPVPGLIISVSSLSGAYGQMGTQIGQVCPTPPITLKETPGTPQALEGLLNNQFNMAFLTNSVLYGKRDIEKDPGVDNLRVVMPLYNSEFHTLALRSNPNVNKFSDSGNKRVGAFGGAIISGQILMGWVGVNPAQFKTYDKVEAGLAALTGNGKTGPEIDVLFVEQGQPVPVFQKLDGNQVKLVEFDRMDLLRDGKHNGFVQGALRYSNLSPSAVPTVATR
jgi:TRAP-type uncharacterized transport system substrate-binding protein